MGERNGVKPTPDPMDRGGANAGHEPAMCGAQRHQAPGPCRKPAGWGTDHVGIGACRLHGGSTRNHRVSAARRATEYEARALLERLGQPEPLGDPVEELLALGAEVRSYLTVLRERLAELREFSSEDVAAIDREKALVRLYGDGLDRTHRVLADLARLGLDERRVRVREAQAGALLVAVARAFDRLGLDAAQQRQARQLIAAELMPGRIATRPTSSGLAQVSGGESGAIGPTSAQVDDAEVVADRSSDGEPPA